MTFLVKHEKILTGILLALLCLFVLSRISSVWIEGKNLFIDTRCYLETSRLILQGVSPYNPETNPTIYNPLQPPSMSLLSMPFCFLPRRAAIFSFYLGGILAFFAFTILIFQYYGFPVGDYLRLRWKNLPIWLVLSMIFTSSPFITMLKFGQDTSMAAFFLFLALLYPKRDEQSNILYLGLSAAIKYSVLTMQVPVLLVQKRWRLCIFSFLLFSFMVLVVGFWLDGIIPAFLEYIRHLLTDIESGANNYSNSRSLFSFVHIGFFQCKPVNTVVKGLLLALYPLALRKIHLRGKAKADAGSGNGGMPGVTALEWGFFTCLTMTISYHRTYDCILFLPFLGVIFLEMMKRVLREAKFRTFNLFWVLGSAEVFLFWVTPFRFVYAAEAWLGSVFPGGEAVFIYANEDVRMFPITKLVMIGTTVFLFAMELFHSSDFSTGIGVSEKEPENDKSSLPETANL